MKQNVKDSNPVNGVKEGCYFIYDLDERRVYPRIDPSGKYLEVRGQKFLSAQMAPLMFGAVISDRRVYNPGDIIRLLVAAPGAGNRTAHLDVTDIGQRVVLSDDASLDDYGVNVFLVRDLEETGEYKATVTLPLEASGGKQGELRNKSFDCYFTIAYHTLSPLLVQIKRQVIGGDALDAEIEVTVLNRPYTGSLNIGLYCDYCRTVVEQKTVDAKNGSVRFGWRLSGHTGPFRLEFSTPDGNTASVSLQSTRVEERQEIQVGNLGELVNVAIVPIPDGRSLRGVNWAPRGVSTSPVIVRTIESEHIIAEATRDLDYICIHSVNPFTSEAKNISCGPVKEGEEFSLKNSAPYQIVMVGCIISAEERSLFEGETVVFLPEKLHVEIMASEKAKPNEDVTITIETDRKATCLVMIYDERLDHENIVGKLGNDIYNQLRAHINVHKLSMTFQERHERVFRLEAAPPALGLMAGVAAPQPEVTRVTTVAAEAFQPGAVPKRAWFPKMLLYKLVEVDGTHKERFKLADTITRWEVQVYAFADLDYVSKSMSIEANLDVAVDLYAPSMIDEDDEYYGKAIYHVNKGKGKLMVWLPDGSHNVEEVEGDGVKEFRIPCPGTIEAELTSTIGGDLVTKIVEPQVSERVMVSTLNLLDEGEELDVDAGKKVFIYGSMKTLLSQSVKALVQYPFGCAEQTSAKLCGLAIAWRSGETTIEIEHMINGGLVRMTKFLQQDGFYSLWEVADAGSPDVTRKVIKNLSPFVGIQKFGDKTSKLFEKPVQKLLENGVQDNALLPLNKMFKAPIKTIEDAANIVLYGEGGSERERALGLIESKAIPRSGGTEAYWVPAPGTWGGMLETTATAIRALYQSDEDNHVSLFKKGFKFVTKRLIGGRLHSTADTRALVELFASIEDFDEPPKFTYPAGPFGSKTEKGSGITTSGSRQVVGLDEIVGSDATKGRKLVAHSRLIARLDGIETIDYRKIKSKFNFELKLEKTSLKLGERVKLAVSPKEQSTCPITKIFLPANTAFLEGGVNVQTISKPVIGQNVLIDIVATGKGKCKLYAILYDMYDSNLIGVTPPIQVTVE